MLIKLYMMYKLITIWHRFTSGLQKKKDKDPRKKLLNITDEVVLLYLKTCVLLWPFIG